MPDDFSPQEDILNWELIIILLESIVKETVEKISPGARKFESVRLHVILLSRPRERHRCGCLLAEVGQLQRVEEHAREHRPAFVAAEDLVRQHRQACALGEVGGPVQAGVEAEARADVGRERRLRRRAAGQAQVERQRRVGPAHGRLAARAHDEGRRVRVREHVAGAEGQVRVPADARRVQGAVAEQDARFRRGQAAAGEQAEPQLVAPGVGLQVDHVGVHHVEVVVRPVQALLEAVLARGLLALLDLHLAQLAQDALDLLAIGRLQALQAGDVDAELVQVLALRHARLLQQLDAAVDAPRVALDVGQVLDRLIELLPAPVGLGLRARAAAVELDAVELDARLGGLHGLADRQGHAAELGAGPGLEGDLLLRERRGAEQDAEQERDQCGRHAVLLHGLGPPFEPCPGSTRDGV